MVSGLFLVGDLLEQRQNLRTPETAKAGECPGNQVNKAYFGLLFFYIVTKQYKSSNEGNYAYKTKYTFNCSEKF